MDGTGCAVWRGLESWDEGLVGVAIDELPMPVVNFLNVIGIEWPYINEDTLHQFATLVRDFGQAVEQTPWARGSHSRRPGTHPIV